MAEWKKLSFAYPTMYRCAPQSTPRTLDIKPLKSPRVITEEQKLNILVTYPSMQAEDAKKQLRKVDYQQQIAELLGYSTKTVRLLSWLAPSAGGSCSHAALPIIILYNSAYCSHMRSSLLYAHLCKRIARGSERVVAHHVLDLMRQHHQWRLGSKSSLS